MMWNMAHLWLKAEVNDLESKVKGGGFPQLSSYLVPDISSFCQHLALLKQLRLFKRFVIVVPSVVTASLDERQKESVGAREAIRWLKNELRHGTRVPVQLGSMLNNSMDHLHLLFQIFHHYHLFLWMMKVSQMTEALASMLVSWYMSGYHTGYYQVHYKEIL
ncbi:nonsense-mediated mRNA decay factor SMG5-like [Tachypleus tridentatus]|uniref:nonsense-mediated mRNA decay factor SMG5-like n=1 Tax=Tachypleus tridentatus TaxID=6853 RepID=UPI003FD424DF